MVRRLRAVGVEKLKYGIADGAKMNDDHLIAIILYTDCKQLAVQLQESHQRKMVLSGVPESEKQYKRRQQDFHHWTRLLREAVELFGTPIAESRVSTFYAATSCRFMLTSYEVRFCGPTSMTTQMQIMSVSTVNGLVLELTATAETSDVPIKYFDCRWLSAFGEESEFLFVGGCTALRVYNIRSIFEEKLNFRIFIKAMDHFMKIVSAEEGDDDGDGLLSSSSSHQLDRCNTSYESVYSEYSKLDRMLHESESEEEGDYKRYQRKKREEEEQDTLCTERDVQIIEILCKKMRISLGSKPKKDGKNEKKEEVEEPEPLVPLYIVDSFKKLVRSRSEIRIHLGALRMNYSPFQRLLICEQSGGYLVRLAFAAKLFSKCTTMIVDMSGYGEQLANEKTLKLVLDVLCDQILKIRKRRNSCLERVVLDNFVSKKCVTLNMRAAMEQELGETMRHKKNQDGGWEMEIFMRKEMKDKQEAEERNNSLAAGFRFLSVDTGKISRTGSHRL